MADLARIKRNVAKMASMNAPEADIDGYIASEGVTVDDVRNYGKDYTLGRIGTIDQGLTFGLGRKLEGLYDAAFGKIGDLAYTGGEIVANIQNKGLKGALDDLEKKPSFWERYHQTVDPTMQAIEQYHEDKPVEAFALELGAGFANPANKLGVNYIKNAKNIAGTAVRSGVVGTGVGGVAGAMNTENTDNLVANTLGGAGAGGIIGTAMPVVANRAGALYNGLKRIVAPEASVAGKATGLGNIVKDNESVRALNRGIMADDAVAAQVLQEAPTEMGRLNEELSDILNKTTGRKLNIEGAKQNADEAYRSYIAQNAGNVKQNAPSLKNIIGGLNNFKQNAMNKALAEGAAMSDYPVGSLDAVHKAQGVLNDMIEASYDKSVLGVKRPTTETSQLMELKKVFNNMLEPSGVKPLDARISKAKSLDYFRDMGYKFKPSEKKFEDLGIKTLRDKQAFLQGRLQAILDNVKDDKNLAKAIRADENTLKKLMPAKKFNELLSETSRIDREYTRLNKFAQMASRELDKPIAVDRPMSERSESLTSYLGSLYDKANARLWQNSNRRRSQALLNGGAVNPEWVQTLENYGAQYSPRYLTPYLAQIIAQNQ